MSGELEPLDYVSLKPAAARVPGWELVVIWLMVACLLLPIIAMFILYLAGAPIDD